MTPDKLKRNFDRCADWEERYLYLIELGERLPAFPTTQLDNDYLIAGCQSNVWLDLAINEEGQISIKASSDSSLVKGLLALVLIAYNEQKVSDVLSFDIKTWFTQLDLQSQLSPSRNQGLEAIVKHILNQAQTVQPQYES
ncbi:cysteine desulfuration protein SufE [Vibrio bathopelagicus]|uniref:cysteine desulfuration protein SufE n=1 Tax=Vibrio bathopelagicus TaxID=2777577 RepID=UPI00186424E0|nr:cysteine desulfuration protein SufE [Vibrio bathopelagicus]